MTWGIERAAAGMADATAAEVAVAWSPYGGWVPGAGETFEAFSTLLTRLGTFETYSFGATGESSITLLEADLDYGFTYFTDELFQTYLGYITPGEIGIYRETWHDPDAAEEKANLYWAIGDFDVLLSEASMAEKVSIANALDEADHFNAPDPFGYVYTGAPLRPFGTPAAGLGDYINTMGYSDDEIAQFIERFGFATEGFSSRRNAIQDIVEDGMNAFTSGISTLAYDTRYINDEVDYNEPISDGEVLPITSNEAQAGTGVGFSTAVTTRTSTTATGTTTTTTSATTTGTSGY
jgi:hypothetical protein